MKDNFYDKLKISLFIITLNLVLVSGCKNKESDTEINKAGVVKAILSPSQQSNDYAVEPPPFSDGIFPCNDCHKNQKPNPTRRVLKDWHDDISAMFNHDSENRWCLDCHDLKNRDSLRLASGKLLDFKESYKLCGQCHGEKYRDWKVGVHGKRSGEWNGKKEYLLCVSCHNPHAPKFKELKPELPPVKQEDIKLVQLSNTRKK
jgi:hypothetical protein